MTPSLFLFVIFNQESSEENDLKTLLMLFPDYKRDDLADIYSACSNKLDWATNVIAESSLFGTTDKIGKFVVLTFINRVFMSLFSLSLNLIYLLCFCRSLEISYVNIFREQI